MRMTRSLGVLMALVLSAGVASADPITGGELYAVFAGGGAFTGASDSYIVTKFAAFDAGSDFPSGLTVSDFPAAGAGAVFDTVASGSEFFMLGWATSGSGDHLLVGTPGALSDPNAFQASLTTAAMGLGGLLGGGVAGTVASAAFWGAGGLADDGPEDFDIPVGVMAATMGGENIFGFTFPVFAGMADFEILTAGGGSMYGFVSYSGPVAASSGPPGGGVGPSAIGGDPPAAILPPPAPIPEPATLLLVAGAAAGAAWRRKRVA
ncbi:MAG: PEP-CTERM sorting domain-containing protein [Planctomycetota bacterium]